MSEEILEGYRVVKTISTGQNSQVLEVVEVASHRHFAMKILLPQKADVAEAKAMMRHEAVVGKELTHPNVVKINYVSQKSSIPFFVMEFFPAGSLKDRLMYKHHREFLDLHGMNILKQTATALAYMNSSGWVHRDMKPNNILVNASGIVKIIDFALAQRVETESFLSKLFRRKKQTVAGTRSYMSPEQILGKPLDGRSDVYSFGATAYELVAFRPPFRAPTQRDLLSKHLHEIPVSPQVYNANVTDEYAQLVLKCLAKKREDRPQGFHAVLKILQHIRIYKTDPMPKSAEAKAEGDASG